LNGFVQKVTDLGAGVEKDISKIAKVTSFNDAVDNLFKAFGE
jgi:hypothetical protein